MGGALLVFVFWLFFYWKDICYIYIMSDVVCISVIVACSIDGASGNHRTTGDGDHFVIN